MLNARPTGDALALMVSFCLLLFGMLSGDEILLRPVRPSPSFGEDGAGDDGSDRADAQQVLNHSDEEISELAAEELAAELFEVIEDAMEVRLRCCGHLLP
jgi:hypothetical protein